MFSTVPSVSIVPSAPKFLMLISFFCSLFFTVPSFFLILIILHSFPVPKISSIPTIEKSQVFHAGTALNGGSLLSTGGRVLTVTGTGSDLTEARDRAYRSISQIELEGSFYRSDIALNASVAEKGN